MPRGGALAIVGADSMGKANDKEVSGDAEEVTQRRSEAPRRRTVAIQALLDEIKAVGASRHLYRLLLLQQIGQRCKRKAV